MGIYLQIIIDTSSEYKKAHLLDFGEPAIGAFIGIMLALFGLGLAIGNYMLLKRMVRNKEVPTISVDKGDETQTDI